jgi:hypothetical protein
MDKLSESLAILERSARQFPTALVAYSGGKDSRVVLDLCTRVFAKVEAMHMYFVPGLRVIEEQMVFARQTWGVECRQYPSHTLHQSLKSGAYTASDALLRAVPPWTRMDVYELARREARTRMVVTGMKASDSNSRKRWLGWQKDDEEMIHPIAAWNKFDVLQYLKARGIPLPAAADGQTTGVSVQRDNLLWLYDTYPDDFDRLGRLFPFIEAVVWQRKWYG